MAKIIKLRGPIREFKVAVGPYSRRGLLTICSSRRGAYSRGAFSRGGGGGAIRGFTVSNDMLLDEALFSRVDATWQ